MFGHPAPDVYIYVTDLVVLALLARRCVDLGFGGMVAKTSKSRTKMTNCHTTWNTDVQAFVARRRANKLARTD